MTNFSLSHSQALRGFYFKQAAHHSGIRAPVSREAVQGCLQRVENKEINFWDPPHIPWLLKCVLLVWDLSRYASEELTVINLFIPTHLCESSGFSHWPCSRAACQEKLQEFFVLGSRWPAAVGVSSKHPLAPLLLLAFCSCAFTFSLDSYQYKHDFFYNLSQL